MTESNQQALPILSVGIDSRNDAYHQSLHWALADLAQQDLALQVASEPSDRQFTLRGTSELHLELICARIWDDFKIEIEAGAPKVLYLETIGKESEAEGKYIRQTGGRGNYGHCKLRLTPSKPNELDQPDTGYTFVNALKDKAIPDEFIASVDEGVSEALKSGILAGYPVVNLTVSLLDGSFHETDSNEMAYRIASSMALKEAAKSAHPLLLEPLMTVNVTVQNEHAARVIADLSSRRGRIDGIESHDGSQVVHATVPLSETLTSSSHGRIVYPMHFARYEPVSHHRDSDDDTAGVPAIKPNLPITGSRSAAAFLDAQFD